MKHVFAALSLVLAVTLFPSFLRAQIEVVTVSAQDVSEKGSPFTVSGTVQIRERTSQAQVREAITSYVQLTNTSTRAVMTFVASLDVTPPVGSTSRSSTQVDCFFGSDVLEPGTHHALGQKVARETAEPYSASAAPKVPRAEVKVVYVQFSDGSVYGVDAYGREIQELRRLTWQHLRRLEKTYLRSGGAAFIEELMEPVEPVQVNTFFENIRQTYKKFGIQNAISQVRTGLQLAEEHQAAFEH